MRGGEGKGGERSDIAGCGVLWDKATMVEGRLSRGLLVVGYYGTRQRFQGRFQGRR
jgi:hypothetical protein